MAVVGGGLVIELFPTNTDSAKSAVIGIGGVSIGVGSVVLFYEIIMIIFVFVEKANHPARLLVVSLHYVYYSDMPVHVAIIKANGETFTMSYTLLYNI